MEPMAGAHESGTTASSALAFERFMHGTVGLGPVSHYLERYDPHQKTKSALHAQRQASSLRPAPPRQRPMHSAANATDRNNRPPTPTKETTNGRHAKKIAPNKIRQMGHVPVHMPPTREGECASSDEWIGRRVHLSQNAGFSMLRLVHQPSSLLGCSSRRGRCLALDGFGIRISYAGKADQTPNQERKAEMQSKDNAR